METEEEDDFDIAEWEEFPPLSPQQRKRGEPKQKKPLNPLDPNDFIEFAKKQGVIRNYPMVDPTSLNRKQRHVYDFITAGLTSGVCRRLLAVGPAGTGKSFIVAALRHFCIANSFHLKVCAFTGAASFNVSGSTIHSTLSVPRGYQKSDPGANAEFVASRLTGLKLLILDELSMISTSLLGFVDLRLRAAFKVDLPFGNISVLMMGDFLQLPPVAGYALFTKNPQAFGLEAAGIAAYESFEDSFFLDEIMRQGPGQEQFREILNSVRIGRMHPRHQRILERRHIPHLPLEKLRPFMDAPFLFAENARRIKYNSYRLGEMIKEGAELVEIQALKRMGETFIPIEGDVLRLCVNSRVMITSNLFIDGGLTNGSMGWVTAISRERTEDGFPTYIFVRPDRYYGFRYPMRDDIPLVPIVRPDKEKGSKKTIQRKAFPLVLGFSFTVHKCQGHTLENVVIGLPPPDFPAGFWRRMSPNLFYVAIGRSTTLEGVLFSQPFDHSLVTSSGSYLEQSLAELERLRTVETVTLQRIQQLN